MVSTPIILNPQARMEQIKQVMRQMISVSEEELNNFLNQSITKTFKRHETVSRPNGIPNEIFFINKGPDPSFNNNFIKPCRRVFDYVDIQKILLDIFLNGNTSRKIGVLNALYWARPTVYYLTVQSGDHIVQQKGYDDFVWDDESNEYIYDFNFVEENSVFEKEYPRQIAAYTEQLSAILSEFYHTTDIELKYHIARRLPNELNQYPEELQIIAKAFLHDKEKQFIPKNIGELEIVKNIDNYFWRKVLLKARRIFIKESGIALKQR